MLKISWTEKRTNVSITEQIGESTRLEDKITRQTLSYFGHIMRSNGLEKSVMVGMGGRSRSRGRPRARWMDDIVKLTVKCISELRDATRDRVEWRRTVMGVTRGRPRPDGTR